MYFRKHFRPKLSVSDDENQENGVSASEEYSQLRRDISTSRPSSSENSVLDIVKNYHIQDDELFEMQRKQVERLKSDNSEPVVVFVNDHSYSSLPTSCFNIASTPCKSPAQYHIVSAELLEDSCSPTNTQSPTTTPLQSPEALLPSPVTPLPSPVTPLQSPVGIITSIDTPNYCLLTNGPVSDSK